LGQLSEDYDLPWDSPSVTVSQIIRTAIGDAFWMASAEIGTSSVGIRKIIFADLGWAGNRDNLSHPGRPLSGAGIGASFLDGLIRVDVAKGIFPEKGIRANLYLEARF
jgi:hemolysin activation/secretion protein